MSTTILTVRTDQEFFERFKVLELKVKNFSMYFQNPGMEITEDEYSTFLNESGDIEEESRKLILDANDRIRLKE